MPVHAVLETSASRSRVQLPSISLPGSPSAAPGTSTLYTHESAGVPTFDTIRMASATKVHSSSIRSLVDMSSSVIASRPHVLIAMCFVIGLDDFGLLCMFFGLLGIYGAGLFDPLRALWAGSAASKDKRLASCKDGVKVPKVKLSTSDKPPQGLLVVSTVLFGMWRLVGPTLGLLDTPVIVDCAFVILVALAYCPFGATTSQSTHAVSSMTSQKQRSSDKPRQSKPLRASVKGAPWAAPAAVGFAGEVERFVNAALPRQQDKVLLRKLTNKATSCIKSVVPEADVTTVAYVNLQAEATEGVVHDSDCYMVVTCDPEILAARLKEYFLKPQSGRRKSIEDLSGVHLRKCATKTFAQRLHFMIFWRSQVGGMDPMVVYVLPPNDFCSAGNRIRVHFIVNCPYHLRLAAVVSEESTRSKGLVLFVVEWAKRRALVNITKGYAHPYAWCLMATYFLRLEAKETLTLLDTVRAFVKYMLSFLEDGSGHTQMYFTLTNNIANTDETSKPCNLPYIEDPRDPCQNVAGTLTADGLARVREELSRADVILSSEGASLSQFFERYQGPVESEDLMHTTSI